MRKHPQNRSLRPSMRQLRSAVSNGTYLLDGVDHRSAMMRRLRDLYEAHVSDLGGHDNISEAERVLCRRAAMIVLQTELLEMRFAKTEDGAASSKQFERYTKATGTLTRLYNTIGVKRRPKDVTPTLDEYLKRKPRLEAAE